MALGFRTEPTAASVARERHAASLVFVALPLFALAAWLDHGRVHSWTALWADAALFAVVLAAHVLDRRRLRQARFAPLSPAATFLRLVAAMGACSLAGVAFGLHAGSFLMLPVLAFALLTLLGNRTMIRRGLVVLTAMLAVETGLELPAEQAVWSTALFTAVAVVVAGMIDEVVRGSHRTLARNRQLAELATETSTLQDWPRDVARLAPRLARAMDVERFSVVARLSSNEPLERVYSWPEPDWPTWEALGTLPQDSLEHMRPQETAFLAAAPARAGAAAVVVVTPATSVPGDPVDVNLLVTVASLLGAVVTRARLISGLVEVARTDELTGVANRRRLFEALAHEMLRARRSRRPLTIAMIDLDHFKQYNDNFGHSAGDDLLQRFALRTTARLRAQDLVARYGGEEFCLILPETDPPGALKLVESLRHGGTASDARGRRVTFSAGLATWDGEESADELVFRADASLYRAKADGRDRIEAAPAAS
jgi:diguanylate cyclase (GGDEF)-like protein